MNHVDAIPLAAGGIVPASFLSRGARVIQKKTHLNNPFFVSRHVCLGIVGCLLPWFPRIRPAASLPPPSPPSKVDAPRIALLFLHQALIVQWLIIVLGPNF